MLGGVLENALEASKNEEKQKKTKKKRSFFLRLPIEDMPQFVWFCFVFVVNGTIKSNYRVINEKFSREK